MDKNDFRRGAVGSRAIANNSIRSGDLRNGTVTGRDVDEGSLEGVQRTGAPAFTPAALQGGWKVTGPNSDPGHWTDGEGTVHLQGGVGGGSGAVFTLPPEARPSRVRASPCRASAVWGCSASGEKAPWS